MLRAAHGDEALTWSNISRWYGRIREGREDAQYYLRSGRHSECRTEGNIEKFRQLLLQNRHLSLRMMADEPDISKVLYETVVEDVNKRTLVLAAR